MKCPVRIVGQKPKAHFIPTPEETQISGLNQGGTESAPPISPQTIALSDEVVLLYVLDRSGCVGQLSTGRIERAGPSQLNVYDKYGIVFEYVSGANLRSWACSDQGEYRLRDGVKSNQWTHRRSALLTGHTPRRAPIDFLDDRPWPPARGQPQGPPSCLDGSSEASRKPPWSNN